MGANVFLLLRMCNSLIFIVMDVTISELAGKKTVIKTIHEKVDQPTEPKPYVSNPPKA